MLRVWKEICVARGSTESWRRPDRAAPGLILALGLLAMAGCGGKANVLPEDGPTMKEIYDVHFGQMRGGAIEDARAKLGQDRAGRGIAPGDGDLYRYTRDAQNEIEGIFPRLPNPTLVMYVFPHLSGAEGAPVPGYSTSFPMYTGVEYALPGEGQQ